MSTHTPERWKVYLKFLNKKNRITGRMERLLSKTYIMHHNDRLIAEVLTLRDEKQKFARMIAAAPEMFELLKKYRFENLLVGSEPEHLEKVFQELMRKIEGDNETTQS